MKIGLIDDGVCIDKELKKNVTFGNMDFFLYSESLLIELKI